MKYFTILICIFLSTLSVYAEINEYMNDVYFANGINTNQQDLSRYTSHCIVPPVLWSNV